MLAAVLTRRTTLNACLTHRLLVLLFIVSLFTAQQVKGYPTLKVYHKGEEVKAYRGGRDLDALKAYIEEAAGELLVETTE
jgi:hypothetical protein